MGRRVEPVAVAGELPDRSHRIASDDQRPDVRRATETLGEDLGADVEPDGNPTAVEGPAVPRIDDRAAARRDDRVDARTAVGLSEVRDRLALERAEGRLAALSEQLRNRAPGRLLDHVIEVDESRPVAMGEPAADGALAAPREADE